MKTFEIKINENKFLVDAGFSDREEKVTVTFPNGVTYKAGFFQDEYKAYIEIFGRAMIDEKRIDSIVLNNKDANLIRDCIDAEKKSFFETTLQRIAGGEIIFGQQSQYILFNSPKEYSQAALKRVYDELKIKNPDSENDILAEEYIFPKMYGKELLALLDKAEAKTKEN